ncbi:MAG: DNA-3-methyladenine glycosylase 2 family protein [Clostridiaceae bacterium]|nr:DNA-3-methyladenine glycosylase 2 family protein [Clostridiaceae bacterium]
MERSSSDETAYFKYGKPEIDLLKKQDPVLGALIDRLGPLRREVRTDRFQVLVDSIVSQQISGKAAQSVLAKLEQLTGDVSPETLTGVSVAMLRSCGLSERKAGWLQNLAREVSDGRMDLGGLDALADDEVVARLVTLPGIGVWTAEMFLIFAMQRPDVVSWGDFGIRRGMSLLYGFETLTKKEFLTRRQAYSPCGTVASLYLWAVTRQEERIP